MARDKSKLNFGLILAIYLLGIFMGALDTGIVTPARTVIQDSLGVDEKSGIWMITIYTLAYAASIPVMGKLADRIGRRTIYLISIFLFGAGSFLCGISHNADSFTFLLASRALQAIGGGGIMPVATAEFGTTFPEEKRGMALGMVGGVYGIANIFGASAGSLVLDIFGIDRWEFIFYVNVPIAVFILIAGFFALPNTKSQSSEPIDGIGITVLVVMILSLMYGLKNIDFFEFGKSLTDTNVYIPLIAFFVLLPLFIFVEKRAKDPVMNLKYFSNIKILMTLCVTVITGIVLMGVIFIPEFCENALKTAEGSGGYFVIILGICAGVGAMSSGVLTDRFGPKLVLSIGLTASIIGSLIVILFASHDPDKLNVFASLIFIGLGIGYTMGAPLNYMMLWEVDENESTSALATLSLVRSIGTVVAPAIMVGFIAHAAAGMSDNIMNVMPEEINIPELPYAQELTDEMKKQNVKGVPDLTEMKTVKIDMKDSGSGDIDIPDEIMDELEASTVTTVTAAVKDMAEYFFDEMTPKMQKEIYTGIDKGINGVSDGIKKLDKNIADMTAASQGMQKGIDGMSSALTKQNSEKQKLEKARSGVRKGYNSVCFALTNAEIQLKKELKKEPLPQDLPPGPPDFDKYQNPAKVGQLTGQIKGMTASKKKLKSNIDKMSQGIYGISTGIAKVTSNRNALINKKESIDSAIVKMKKGRAEAADTLHKMKVLRAAVPGAFEKSKEDYLKQIDSKSDELEDVYQSTINIGFRQIFLMTAIGSAVGILLLMLYRRKKPNKKETENE